MRYRQKKWGKGRNCANLRHRWKRNHFRVNFPFLAGVSKRTWRTVWEICRISFLCPSRGSHRCQSPSRGWQTQDGGILHGILRGREKNIHYARDSRQWGELLCFLNIKSISCNISWVGRGDWNVHFPECNRAAKCGPRPVTAGPELPRGVTNSQLPTHITNIQKCLIFTQTTGIKTTTTGLEILQQVLIC